MISACIDDPAWDIRATLRSVRVPTLVVARRTPTLNLEAAGKEMASLIPDARLVLFDDVAGGRYTNDGSTPGLVHAIDDFLASLPGSPADPATTTARALADGLSSREVEVLRLLAMGRSNAQIADELVISPNTVNRHVSNIYAKTGAANRAEAASYATRNGIAAMNAPPVQYVTTSDGVSIAYGVAGEGIPLVRVPSMYGHFSLQWKRASWTMSSARSPRTFKPSCSTAEARDFDAGPFGEDVVSKITSVTWNCSSTAWD